MTELERTTLAWIIVIGTPILALIVLAVAAYFDESINPKP